MTTKTKTYLAFLGQLNTTFGKPHPVTGRFDIYGGLYEFRTKKDRDDFCDVYNHDMGSYPVATNKKKAKSLYFAGCTQEQFDDILSMWDFS